MLTQQVAADRLVLDPAEALQRQAQLVDADLHRHVQRRQRLRAHDAVGIQAVPALEVADRVGQVVIEQGLVEGHRPGARRLREVAAGEQALAQLRDPRIALAGPQRRPRPHRLPAAAPGQRAMIRQRLLQAAVDDRAVEVLAAEHGQRGRGQRGLQRGRGRLPGPQGAAEVPGGFHPLRVHLAEGLVIAVADQRLGKQQVHVGHQRRRGRLRAQRAQRREQVVARVQPVRAGGLQQREQFVDARRVGPGRREVALAVERHQHRAGQQRLALQLEPVVGRELVDALGDQRGDVVLRAGAEAGQQQAGQQPGA